MNDLQRAISAAALVAAAAACAISGCDQRRPVTVLFTGDEHGRLVPAG